MKREERAFMNVSKLCMYVNCMYVVVTYYLILTTSTPCFVF